MLRGQLLREHKRVVRNALEIRHITASTLDVPHGPPTEKDMYKDKVTFFVQVSNKHYCMHLPMDTTINETLAQVWFKQGAEAVEQLSDKGREWFGSFALQRTTGAHLRGDKTLEHYKIQKDQTLVMSGKGPGGANNLHEQIKVAEKALEMYKMICEMEGMQDDMHVLRVETYNKQLEKVRNLYCLAGMDPDADDAAVAAHVPIAIQEAPEDDWVPPPPEDPADDDDNDDNDGDSQPDSQAPTLSVVADSPFWNLAKQHPKHDPRIKPAGRQWIPDHLLEKCMKDSHKNPNGKGNDYTLTDSDKERLMGARKIDHSLSGLAGSHWEDLIREIGMHFFCGPKQPDVIRPNDDGSEVRPLSCMINSKPVNDANTVVQSVLKGVPQGGKSREAILDCWAKHFVHACMPFYYVRNSGGLNDSMSICKDFEAFGNEIRAYCTQLKRDQPANFSWLTEEMINKVVLVPRLMTDCANNDKYGVSIEVEPVALDEISMNWAEEVEQEGADSHWAWRLSEPQVIVGLMNAPAMNKFMHTGCVIKKGQPPLNLDGAGYMVNRNELSKVFIGTKRDGKMKAAQITPFALFFGIHNVSVTFQQHGKKAAVVHAGAHPGKAMLHSAYGPCCWDTSKPYDQLENCKRGRIARCVDEIDTTTSENKKHKVGDYTYDSNDVTKAANMALDPNAAKIAEKAVKDKNASESDRDRVERLLKGANEELERLRNGEAPSDSADERREKANDARASRAVRRATGAPAAAASSSQYDDDDDDDDDPMSDEDGGVVGFLGDRASDDDDDDDDDDDNASHASLFSTDSAQELAKAARQAKWIETKEREVERLESELSELEEDYQKFAAAEAKAMRNCLGRHVQGMAGAAMYNMGITATIFGCMQPIKDGKVKAQTRLERMPTPDAYNQLARWDEDAGEWRDLDDPCKKSKRGSIKIMEAPVKAIGLYDLGRAENKNRFYAEWMLKHGHATKNPNGDVVPEHPVAPCNARGSYTIRPAWYECSDDKNGERPMYPWVAEMVDDFTKAKKLQNRRMHNSWERNKTMFRMTLEQLQAKRLPLKKQRRCAQGMIISGETRFTATKDKLIADLFVRNSNDPGGLMHEMAAYNYAGERLSLYFRPENLDTDFLEKIIDNPDGCLHALRNYLEGDPTMHYAYTDAKTGAPKTKLDDDWLKAHYIRPIRAELRRCVQREPPNAAQLAKWETDKTAAKACGDSEMPRCPLGHIKFDVEAKVATDAVTEQPLGEPVNLVRVDFSKPTPEPRLMATLFTLIDAMRYEQDPDGMLPMPFIGMTKTAGGRAARYMCHGHRSRIQVMAHTFDIFPNRRLGLAMCDAIQEGFRCAGFDEYERWGTDADRARSGCEGKWMDDWVDQVYISTKDFVPLLQNALMSQEEWCRLLEKEQNDRIRFGESEEAYAKRLKETPSETLTRVVGGEVIECFKAAINVWRCGAGRPPTCEDMPETNYPHLHKWLLSHVNRAPSVKLRFLRHSQQNGNEEAMRNEVKTMCWKYLEAEVKALRLGEACDFEGGASRFDTMVEELDKEIDEAYFNEEVHEKHEKMVFENFHGKIPLPRYSAVHASGGDLETRDREEAANYHSQVRDLLAGRDEIAEQYALRFGKGYAFNHKSPASKQEAKWLAGAQRMKDADVETDGGDAKYLGYKVPTIKAWLVKTDGGRTRKRKGLATNGAFMPEVGEATDKARLTALMEACKKALEDPTRIAIVDKSIAEKPPAAFRAKATTAGNLERARQRIEEVLSPLTGQEALTLVDQLPSALCEWPLLVDLLEKAFEGTVIAGSKKAFSIGTAFKWAAVALGLTDFTEGDGRQWNLRKFTEELDSPEIRAAQATVDADSNAQIRINNRRQARHATNAAAIQAAAEAEIPRRVRPRLAAGDDDDDEDME